MKLPKQIKKINKVSAEPVQGVLSQSYFCAKPKGCTKYTGLSYVRTIYMDKNWHCFENECGILAQYCTAPRPVPCPVGIRIISPDAVRISIKKAIDLFHTVDCGSRFVGYVNLVWPVTPECPEPIYVFHTDLGGTLTIGAYTGNISCA